MYLYIKMALCHTNHNILKQCQKQSILRPHPTEVDIMSRHENDSGIYIRSVDERVGILQIYKPGWATHLKQRSESYTGAPTYVRHFISIADIEYGKMVEYVFKRQTREYRCYSHAGKELRRMPFATIVKLFENICKYTKTQLVCEIKRLRKLKPGFDQFPFYSTSELQEIYKKILKTVFKDTVRLKRGKHKGKLACYEPRNNSEVSTHLKVIDKITPEADNNPYKSRGGGTTWFKKTGGVLKLLEDNGVKHYIRKARVMKRGRGNQNHKEQVWILGRR